MEICEYARHGIKNIKTHISKDNNKDNLTLHHCRSYGKGGLDIESLLCIYFCCAIRYHGDNSMNFAGYASWIEIYQSALDILLTK